MIGSTPVLSRNLSSRKRTSTQTQDYAIEQKNELNNVFQKNTKKGRVKRDRVAFEMALTTEV